MSIISQLKTGARNITGRSEVEAELDEEVRAYVELLIAENSGRS